MAVRCSVVSLSCGHEEKERREEKESVRRVVRARVEEEEQEGERTREI